LFIGRGFIACQQHRIELSLQPGSATSHQHGLYVFLAHPVTWYTTRWSKKQIHNLIECQPIYTQQTRA